MPAQPSCKTFFLFFRRSFDAIHRSRGQSLSVSFLGKLTSSRLEPEEQASHVASNYVSLLISFSNGQQSFALRIS